MTARSPEATVPRPRFILHVVLQDDWWGQIYQQGDAGGIFAKDGSASEASPDYRVFGEKVALPSDDVQKATQTFEQCVAVAAGQSPLEETRAAVATGEGTVLDRALAETLAAEVYRLQAALQTAQRELGEARQQVSALQKAVMLAVLNIDLERNGLTPDGNVRARLVAALADVDRPAQPHEKALEHVCGLQGFGAIGDECPACNARMARTPGDPS